MAELLRAYGLGKGGERILARHFGSARRHVLLTRIFVSQYLTTFSALTLQSIEWCVNKEFYFVGSEVLSSGIQHRVVSLEDTRRFGGKLRLHLKSQRISQARNHRESGLLRVSR